MSGSAAAQRVRDLVEPTLAGLDLRVEDVTVMPAGRRRVVRIAIDDDLSGLDAADETSLVPGLDLDRVAEATRVVSAVLDEADVLGQAPYVLEVSSPGVNRPLTRPHHFRRNVGRLLRLTLVGGGQPPGGRLVAAGPETIRLRVPGSTRAPDHEATYAYTDIARADVEVEFAGDGEQEDD